MFINLWSKDGNLYGSTRASGKLQIREIGPAEYVAFVRSGTMLSAESFDTARDDVFPGWKRVTFRDYDQRKAALEKYGELLFEADVSPAKRYLFTNDIRLETPLCVYFDIETDSRVPPRVQVEEGTGRILAAALSDANGVSKAFVLDEDSDDDEARMLAEVWEFLGRYDQVAAWFGSTFDFPVLELRSQKLARGRSKLFAPYWEHRRRLLMVDHALCFKRHHMSPESGDDKTSMKLNAVCQSILGEGKHDFNAAKTWEAWAAGGAERQRMVDYCVQDTALLPKLEAETGYLALQQTLAEVSFTPADSRGLRPMPQVDGLMLRKAHLQQTHLPSKKPPTGNEAQYEGAFVLPPTRLGVHRMVHVCDFKSLYPTVIRSLNIGAETKDELGMVAFGTDVSFGSDVESALAGCCRDLMEKRDYWKKKAKADPNDKYAERMNKAYKIACNSVYGVLGSPWSRFYDVQIAESVTLGAKALIVATMEEAKKWDLECIYGDTDSCFIIGCTVERFKEFVAHCNTVLYPRMLAERGANLDFNCIELDYEKCFKLLVFPMGKDGDPVSKRYIGSYLHYAFRPKTKPEIRGLEYMRGDGVRIARHAQKEIIDRILAEQNEEQLEEYILNLRQRIMDAYLPVEDIQLSKGIGQELSAYKVASPHVRLARELEAAGEDVGPGAKIAYVIVNANVSPAVIISADDYTGEFDRHNMWNKLVYPCLLRVLSGAFPTTRNWNRWVAKRPKPALAGQTSLF